MRPSTPIELRIPNAAQLVGRAREYRRVRALVSERRVAIVTGPGGIGKTHLAVRTVHDALGADAGRALYVGCRSAERGALGTAVLRALLGEPHCAITWTPQTRIAAIDFADREELWIVLDDLHEAPKEEAEALLHGIRIYARRSVWIATSRTRAPDGAEDLEVALGPMPAPDLAALACDWLPEARSDERDAAVASAEGSPFLLRQLLFASRAPRSPGPRAGALAALLSALRIPIEAALLPIDRREIDEGIREGWIVAHESSVRLHDEARAFVPALAPDSATIRELASTLARSDDGALQLEALRLFLRLGDHDAARALLDRHTKLLALSRGPELYGLVRAAPRELAEQRVRAAAAFGAAWALAEIEEPPEDATVGERAAHVEISYLRGHFDRAAREGLDVTDRAEREGDRRAASRALVVAAIARAVTGDPSAAYALSERALALGIDEVARWRTLRLMTLVDLDRTGEAERFAAESRALLPELPRHERGLLASNLVRELYRMGRVREAAQIAAEIVPEASPVAALARRTLQFAMAVHCVAGDFDRAEAIATALSRSDAGDRWARAVRLPGPLYRGDAPRLRSMLAAADPGDDDEIRAWTELIGVQLATYEGRAADATWTPHAKSAFGERLRIYRAENEWLRGAAVEIEEVRTDRQTAWIARGVRARLALYDAKTRARARAELAELRSELADAGCALTAIDALAAIGEGAILDGDRAALNECAELLRARAREMRSPRFEDEASFFAHLGDPETDPGAFVAIARESRCARTTRRALALVGEPTTLDRADAALAPAIRALAGLREVVAPARTGPSWVIDARTRSAFVEGQRIDLYASQKNGWRVLETLFERGGEASKEELVLSVWSPAEYHPLRHDNRLRLVVRRLRAVLGEHAEPARILTTETGYALAGAYVFA